MIGPKNIVKENRNEKDYLDFINSKGSNPSAELNNQITNYVRADLNPSHKIVFSKLLGIQAFIGFLTLLFCPQFEISLINNHQLFHYFYHNLGETICTAICGSIFVGSGALFAAYLLKSSEIKKIKNSKILYYASVSIIALSTLFIFGAQVYLNLAIFWFIGASLGGLVVFELNRVIRREIFQY